MHFRLCLESELDLFGARPRRLVLEDPVGLARDWEEPFVWRVATLAESTANPSQMRSARSFQPVSDRLALNLVFVEAVREGLDRLHT